MAEDTQGHLAREQIRETPEVHITGICVDLAGSPLRLLIARRAKSRRLYPDRWEGCGGQLRRSETFMQGVARHFAAEMKLDVEVFPAPFCSYEIIEPDEPLIPGLRYLCKRRVAVEPTLRPDRHSEFRWVTVDELRAMPAGEFISGWREETLELLRQLREASGWV